MTADIPWVKRGAQTGHCCGLSRRRITIELPGPCNGTIEEAIGEFFRNSKCDCPGAEFHNLANEKLDKIVGNFIIETEALMEALEE